MRVIALTHKCADKLLLVGEAGEALIKAYGLSSTSSDKFVRAYGLVEANPGVVRGLRGFAEAEGGSLKSFLPTKVGIYFPTSEGAERFEARAKKLVPDLYDLHVLSFRLAGSEESVKRVKVALGAAINGINGSYRGLS